jgi:hypothetical protein
MRTHSCKNVNVVGHAVYLEHFMLVFLKDAGDLLMQSFSPVTANKSGPVFSPQR